MMSRATHASHQSTGADLMQGQDPCFTLKLPDTTNWIFQYLFISSLVVMIDIFTINAVKCYCRPLVLNLDPDITEAAAADNIYKTGRISGINVGVLLIRSWRPASAHDDIFLGVFLDYMNPPSSLLSGWVDARLQLTPLSLVFPDLELR